MKLVLDLHNKLLGYKTIRRILEAIFGVFDFVTGVPCCNTIRNWILTNSYANSKPHIEQSNDSCLLTDSATTIGEHKLLLTLGTRMSPLLNRNDCTLTCSDIKVLDVFLTKKLNGDVICAQVSNVVKKLGDNPVGFVVDPGCDVKRGSKLLQEKFPNVTPVIDIPHKMALLIKYELENLPEWISYTKHSSTTTVAVRQTELAVIKPPPMRIKGRYMSVKEQTGWFFKTSDAINAGRLEACGITTERFLKFFPWFHEFEKPMHEWAKMFKIAEIVNSEIRKRGLSKRSCKHIQEAFIVNGLTKNPFASKALNAVREEADKLKPKQVVICSTEIVESVFGKYKHFCGVTGQGMTSHALTISNLVCARMTPEAIKNEMESTTVREALKWVQELIGDAFLSVRKKFYRAPA